MPALSKPIKRALIHSLVLTPVVGGSLALYQGHQSIPLPIGEQLRKLLNTQNRPPSHSLLDDLRHDQGMVGKFFRQPPMHLLAYGVIAASFTFTAKRVYSIRQLGNAETYTRRIYHSYHTAPKSASAVSSLVKIYPTLFRKCFTHSFPFHLGLNCYILYNFIDLSEITEKLKKQGRTDLMDLSLTESAMVAFLLGMVFSLPLAKLTAGPNVAVMGISGGIYSLFGYHYDYQLEQPKFKMIFDVRDEPFNFGIQDLKYMVLVEAGISVMQAAKLISWPIGHIAHVTGYSFGAFVKFCEKEGARGRFYDQIEEVKETSRKIFSSGKNPAYEAR